MASVHAADTWREAGGRADRPAGGTAAPRSGRPAPGERPARPPLPPLPPLPSHGRSAGPGQRPAAPVQRPAPAAQRPAPAAQRPVPPAQRPAAQGRPPVPPADRSGGPRHPGEPARATPGYPRPSAGLSPDADRRRARPPVDDAREQDRRPGARATGREGRAAAPAVPERGSRLRGSVAVLGVLLVTLAAGYVDAIGTTGLGMITLVGLVASTAVATLLVRRRDLTTMVVAPPLVLLAVTAVHVLTSPAFAVGEGRNPVLAAGTAVATKLVLGGGFPIMAAATGTALVLALVRWAARR
ncbi:DUF6542 domain-containing protein [Trujillonella humicola]|uniref:DUF6542 domain-containing protein n=1 Tax=Trujillonella humicola TaxID=3383699 RepID=UPI0039066882